MNRAQIRNRIRRQTLVEESELSSTQIDQDLVLGLLDVASRFRWPFFYKRANITHVPDQAEYDLPEDLMFLDTLVYADEGRASLERTDEQVIKAVYGDQPGASSLPHLWVPTEAQKIRFVPTPSSDAQVILSYYRSPNPSVEFNNDNHEPPWHPSFHSVLVDYGIATFWEREEDEQKAAFYWGRYFNGIERMAQFYTNRLPTQKMVIGGGRRIRHRRPPFVGWPE